MEGLLAAYVIAGFIFLLVFEGSYREKVKPNTVQYFAFVALVLLVWPFVLMLVQKKRRS